MTRKETLIYFILGAVNIASGIAEITWLNYLTKPFLMLTLMLFYFQKTKQNLTLQDKIMLASLLFSCFGDSFLMFQGQNPNFFLFGLGSFLVAQIAYCIVFSKGGKRNLFKRTPFVFYAATLFLFLKPSIPNDFLLPIIVYTFAITWMGNQAVERQTNTKSYQYVLIGAILFIISDSFIAVNKFAFGIPLAGVWIMLTYIIAQYLIVEGVLLGRGNKTNTL
jgi:uncharacterized membrane protein YhhN